MKGKGHVDMIMVSFQLKAGGEVMDHPRSYNHGGARIYSRQIAWPTQDGARAVPRHVNRTEGREGQMNGRGVQGKKWE